MIRNAADEGLLIISSALQRKRGGYTATKDRLATRRKVGQHEDMYSPDAVILLNKYEPTEERYCIGVLGFFSFPLVPVSNVFILHVGTKEPGRVDIRPEYTSNVPRLPPAPPWDWLTSSSEAPSSPPLELQSHHQSRPPETYISFKGDRNEPAR